MGAVDKIFESSGERRDSVRKGIIRLVKVSSSRRLAQQCRWNIPIEQSLVGSGHYAT